MIIFRNVFGLCKVVAYVDRFASESNLVESF
jgi:hypothetical protein